MKRKTVFPFEGTFKIMVADCMPRDEVFAVSGLKLLPPADPNIPGLEIKEVGVSKDGGVSISVKSNFRVELTDAVVIKAG